MIIKLHTGPLYMRKTEQTYLTIFPCASLVITPTTESMSERDSMAEVIRKNLERK